MIFGPLNTLGLISRSNHLESPFQITPLTQTNPCVETLIFYAIIFCSLKPWYSPHVLYWHG